MSAGNHSFIIILLAMLTTLPFQLFPESMSDV